MYRRNNQFVVQSKLAISVACLVVLLVLCLNASWASNVSVHNQTAYNDLPSITAVLRRYSSQLPDVYTEAWVSFSPLGLRVTDLATQSEIIKNFVTGKVWIVNRRRKTQHEINVPAFENQFPELVEFVIGPDTQSNLLGREPCVEWHKALHGERVWRGQIVEDWNCTEVSGVLVSEQLYSNRLGIVVRVQHPNSIIEELRDISEQVIDVAVYQAETDFKSVSLDEFFDDTSRLGKYSDSQSIK